MQFGRIHGIALAVLGLLLFGIQAALFFSSPAVSASANPAVPAPQHRTYPVPGILGAVSFFAGIVIFATRRRADEPRPENAVR